MAEFLDRRPDHMSRALRPSATGASSPVRHLALALQSTAGNAAVAAALHGPTVQRQGGTVSGGGTDDAGRARGATNPIVAALWEGSVQTPLHQAANAMSDEQPDYRTAFESSSRAQSAVGSVLGSLPAEDPRKPKGNYLIDDLTLVETVLAPRAGIPVSSSDDDIAAKLGGLEYDAQVVGESVGAKAAPRQTVNPDLDRENGQQKPNTQH
jgi:hypothetical protein